MAKLGDINNHSILSKLTKIKRNSIIIIRKTNVIYNK